MLDPSFHCRHFWLKKGYDHLNGKSTEEPTVALGVGKNMVASIYFWLRAFDLVKEKEPEPIAKYLFDDLTGKDPFLEDLGTLWLLHYQLVKSQQASIYHIAFNDFRKKHVDGQFTTDQLRREIVRLHNLSNKAFSERTIETDIKVFIRNYVATSRNKRDIEDDLASIFIDLNLIHQIGMDQYKINVTERHDVPSGVFLFAILDAFNIRLDEDQSLTFDDIQRKVGDIFACNKEGLEWHIEKIQERYPSAVVYKEDAGRKEIQLKAGEIKSVLEILDEYYG